MLHNHSLISFFFNQAAPPPGYMVFENTLQIEKYFISTPRLWSGYEETPSALTPICVPSAAFRCPEGLCATSIP